METSILDGTYLTGDTSTTASGLRKDSGGGGDGHEAEGKTPYSAGHCCVKVSASWFERE